MFVGHQRGEEGGELLTREQRCVFLGRLRLQKCVGSDLVVSIATRVGRLLNQGMRLDTVPSQQRAAHLGAFVSMELQVHGWKVAPRITLVG